MEPTNAQTQQTTPAAQPPPQWMAFVQAVNQAAMTHGVQAVILSAAIPGDGGFGPTRVHTMPWLMGPAPAAWCASVAPAFAEGTQRAVESLSRFGVQNEQATPPAPPTEEAAAEPTEEVSA